MQWSRNTLTKGLLRSSAVGIAIVFSGQSLAADIDTAKNDANTVGGAVQSRYGSPDALNRNLNIPMTNSSTQMSTVDGSKSFGAALGIPSSNKFLEVVIQPSSTGDLSNVIVAQDLDANGTFDYTFNVGKPVSGVCTNGFISCLPGTWNNCGAYGWVSDSSGKLQVSISPITQLSGCFCINSSCGSNLAWTNSGVILQALGGGAVGAIRVKDAATTITDVAMDPVMITYYGQLVRKADSSGAAAVPATSSMAGPQTQQGYYTDWTSLDSAKDNISLTQASDPNSLYYQLNNSAAATNAQIRNCGIARNGVINTTLEASDFNTGYSYLYTEHYFDMMIWQLPDKDTYKLQLMDWYDGVDHHGVLGKSWHEPMDTNGYHTIHTFTLPLNTATSASKLSKALFSVKIVSGAGCTPGSVFSIDGVTQGFNNRINVGGYCGGSGVQHPYLEWSYLFELQKDAYNESINDSCTTLEADPTCRLRSETVDGVPTARDYASTGLHQLPTCRSFIGAVQPFEICRPWWQKKREYVCDVSMPAFDLTRYKTIKETTAVNGTTFSFNDYRQNPDGTWSTVTMSGTLPQGDSYENCMPTCKIKRPIQHSELTVAGSVSANMVEQSSFETRYLSCGTDNVCPVQTGDTIITPCGCIDEFKQAAVLMQSMRLSGADNICSSGTPVPP